MRSTQLIALATLPVLVSAWCVPAAAAQEAADGAPVDVDASVVWVDTSFPAQVEVPWEAGGSTLYGTTIMSYCTGFFVSDSGHIATAGHCLEPDGSTVVAAIDDVLWQLEYEGHDISGLDALTLDWDVTFDDPTATVGQPSGVEGGILSGEMLMTAQIVDLQSFEKGDNALLRVADLDGTPGLPIGEGTPAVGDEVVAIGFAGSISGYGDVQRQRASYKFGTVSSRQYSRQGVPSTEIDAAVTNGMSGGPALAEDGSVIGVNSFGLAAESQPFNFVTDTETLRDFLTRNGVDLVEAVGAEQTEEGGAPPEDAGAGTAATDEDATTAPEPGSSTTRTDELSTGAGSPVADTPLPLPGDGTASGEGAVPSGSGPGATVWIGGALAGVLLLLVGLLAGRVAGRRPAAG